MTEDAIVVVSGNLTLTPLAPEAAALDAMLSANVDNALLTAVDALVGAADRSPALAVTASSRRCCGGWRYS